jgi:hypothetical protein
MCYKKRQKNNQLLNPPPAAVKSNSKLSPKLDLPTTPPNQPTDQKDIPTVATNKSVGTPLVLPDGKASEAAINKIGPDESIPGLLST